MRVARSRPRPLPPRAPAYGSRPQGVALQQCTGQIGRVGMRKAKAPQGCTNATGISARMHTKAAWTPDLAARSHATQSGRWTSTLLRWHGHRGLRPATRSNYVSCISWALQHSFLKGRRKVTGLRKIKIHMYTSENIRLIIIIQEVNSG
ncbi:uncharacterized protein LOC143269020 isoform X1 [Peromyscus maniculatus bairdii]|uniref:uncharacterized protein LOC143269020 isoform X1 n=1 Tax=Peromyscus maniculatus bairdii TaxID=230844 RepID=UPI003FD3353B